MRPFACGFHLILYSCSVRVTRLWLGKTYGTDRIEAAWATVLAPARPSLSVRAAQVGDARVHAEHEGGEDDEGGEGLKRGRRGDAEQRPDERQERNDPQGHQDAVECRQVLVTFAVEEHPDARRGEQEQDEERVLAGRREPQVDRECVLPETLCRPPPGLGESCATRPCASEWACVDQLCARGLPLVCGEP